MVVNKLDRAKQFLPFDALKGFREALHEKEIEYEEKKELLEDSLIELENEFNKIELGCSVKIKFYNNGKYIDIKGIVNNIDYIKKKLQVNECIINMSDIIKIEIK